MGSNMPAIANQNSLQQKIDAYHKEMTTCMKEISAEICKMQAKIGEIG